MQTIKLHIWSLLASLGILLPSCMAQPTGLVKNKSYDRTLSTLLDTQEVSVVGVEELYQEKKEENVLLDTRSREEYEVSHIPGAIWVGYDSFDPSSVLDLDKSKKIVVYCSVGYRSEKIGKKLKELGFQEVVNLYGSIFEWANRSYPLVNPQGDTVNQLHAYNRFWGQWIDNSEVEKKY